MEKKFQKYINQQQLFQPQETVLLAVSGGVDSVVMLDLFVKCNYKIALAHCNFNLRGTASDADEQFVRNLVERYKIPSHFIHFDTSDYAKKQKISIEMAARNLRYNWFENLLEKYGYDYLATGHHLNDSIETLFLNLSRGTGYSGINGIAPKRGKIIRPLLFATRLEIEQYADSQKFDYCIDATNEEEKFIRNKIRKQIIPIFKEINPAFEEVMKNNFNNLNDASKLLDIYFEKYRQEALKKEGTTLKIPYEKIENKNPLSIHLFELLSPFGFRRDSIQKIEKTMNKNIGGLFLSTSHRLLIERDGLIIEKLKHCEKAIFEIKKIEDFANIPLQFSTKIIDYKDFKLIKKKTTACLDFDKISFPLRLCIWQKGDYFYPLGMSQKQKVSDFLINNKVNRFEKENTWVLKSETQIIWLVNHRIDNRYKVTDQTKKVWIIDSSLPIQN